MKNILLFMVAMLYINTCFSQDVIDRKKALTALVTEKYHTVIGTNKEEKQGQYQAFYNKILIADGRFTNDKKIGIWHFYNRRGKPAENFDYDTNNLSFEAFEDTTSNIRYFVDTKLAATDNVTKPVKIGGRYYGYIPYLKLFKLPAYIQNDIHERYNVILELLVSPGGRLADYKIHIKQGVNEDIIPINTDLLKEQDKLFIPATLNNQPVSCRIFIQCYINYYDEIDMY